MNLRGFFGIINFESVTELNRHFFSVVYFFLYLSIEKRSSIEIDNTPLYAPLEMEARDFFLREKRFFKGPCFSEEENIDIIFLLLLSLEKKLVKVTTELFSIGKTQGK